MYQPSKWWLGLALPAILWGVANLLSDNMVEKDLVSKATAAYPWVKPSFSGRDTVIGGTAPNDTVKSQALSAIDAIPGVRRVQSTGLAVVAEAKPYKWQAVRDGNKIMLNGFYPDEKTHQNIIGAAKKSFSNAQITDEMKLARGVPAGFEASSLFGLNQLGNLSSGTASLDNAKYSITGVAPTVAVYNGELAKVKALPQGISLAIVAISPPVSKPYIWSVMSDNNIVTLSGFVPSEAVRTKNIEATKAAMPSATVVDKQVIGSGEPAGFDGMTGYAIAQLGKLIKGSAQLEDKAYSLVGEAATMQIYDASLAATKTLPVGFVATKAAITAPIIVAPVVAPVIIATPPVIVPEHVAKQIDICSKEFTSELNNSSIYFDIDKDTIRQVSFAVLDRLVEVAKKCPDVTVEIGAHTDSDGAAAYNQDLSERRAKSVLDYMKVRIDTSKYTAIGYGEAKPIASNLTDEGKQKNRRVEFIVK